MLPGQLQVVQSHAEGGDIIQLMPLYDMLQHRGPEYNIIATEPGSVEVEAQDMRNVAVRSPPRLRLCWKPLSCTCVHS